MLPEIIGEFGIVMNPEVRFSESGKCWVKLRGVAKDRKRDSNGEWVDGDPIFIDILTFGKQAENLAESVDKGDTVLVKGRLAPSNWTDKEGTERKDMKIMVDEIAVSVRWNPARTPTVSGDKAPAPAAASAPQSDEAPF